MEELRGRLVKVTRNGNIIIGNMVISASGRFIRLISEEEQRYFRTLSMLEVIIESDIVVELPDRWRYWFSTEEKNNCDHEWDCCNDNSSCFGSWLEHHFYIRHNGGINEVLRLDVSGDTSNWLVTIDGKRDDFGYFVEFLDAEPYRIIGGNQEIGNIYVQNGSNYSDKESIDRFGERVGVDIALGSVGSYTEDGRKEYYELSYLEFYRRVRRVCNILGCTPNELIGRRINRRRINRKMRSRVRKFSEK